MGGSGWPFRSDCWSVEKSRRQSAIYKNSIGAFFPFSIKKSREKEKTFLRLTKAGCMRSLFVASRLQVKRDMWEYAPANRASVASTCPWARYNRAYFFLGHGPLFFQLKVINMSMAGKKEINILESKFGAVKKGLKNGFSMGSKRE